MQPSTVALSSSWCCWALRFRYWKACASFTFLASCCPSEAPASTPKWTRTAPKWPWGVLSAPPSLPLLPWGASQGFRKCPATENWFFLNQNLKKWISLRNILWRWKNSPLSAHICLFIHLLMLFFHLLWLSLHLHFVGLTLYHCMAPSHPALLLQKVVSFTFNVLTS